MAALNFAPDSQPTPDDIDDLACRCPIPDDKYLLEIEEGQVVLKHAACGKEPPANWGDWHDLVVMPQMRVTARPQSECNGEMWHGDTRCDCGYTIEVAPSNEVKESAR